MTNKWNFAFDNAPLRPELVEKLDRNGILRDVDPTAVSDSDEVRFIKDFFTHDGYPKLPDGTDLTGISYPYIFPVIAPWYDGASIPASALCMEPGYRQTACQAALTHLKNLNACGIRQDGTNCSFHGLAFQKEVLGTTHTFAFPDTQIRSVTGLTAAVVLIADSYRNDEAWQKQAGVPLYAREQAMFQLWCWEQFADISGYNGKVPSVAFVVRICGNLPTDCTIRTVLYNRNEAEAMVKRICKARNAESTKGLYWNRNVEEYQSWSDKLTNEAYHCTDADQYDLITAYMKAKKDRKANEAELNEVSDRMTAIAIELAAAIPSGCIQGNYQLPDGTICTVTHQLRRSRAGGGISAELLRSFFPNLEECVVATSQERETVTIDVL